MRTISSGMVLAAGEGRRMRPITERLPKPLISIAGKPLLDHALEKLNASGVDNQIVNCFYLGDQIKNHCADRKVVISEEHEKLETGGGVAQALPLLGSEPFFVLNGDNLTLDGPRPALDRLRATFDPDRMDALLLVHPIAQAHGYVGQGDFNLDQAGRLTRRGTAHVSAFVFTGVQILKPDIFQGHPAGSWSLNWVYDRAADRERLYGLVHDGAWFHVSQPDDIQQTEAILASNFLNLFC